MVISIYKNILEYYKYHPLFPTTQYLILYRDTYLYHQSTL